jgi:hypothetical protein
LNRRFRGMRGFMLRRFLKDRRGASEIVGTALFLIILFFFFSNVFLWHNQITSQMDQVVADRMNSGIRMDVSFNETDIWLTVVNVGGLDVSLSRLWIITGEGHLYADFGLDVVHVGAGRQLNITIDNVTDPVSDEVGVSLVSDPIEVKYKPPVGDTVVFRMVTKRANTAACSLTLQPE